MPQGHRYLGLELAGTKSGRTALAVLEYYPKEKKLFLRDVLDRLPPSTPLESTDEALVQSIESQKPHLKRIGVNVPLDLPPCLPCTKKKCPFPTHCTVPEVAWMREQIYRAHPLRRRAFASREVTPYTQRPVEVWLRHSLLPKLPEAIRPEVSEIHEALGANQAPLTARLQFLKRHFSGSNWVEVWPKLSIALVAHQTLQLSPRILSSYRHLEQGIDAREEILHQLQKHTDLFIYDRDLKKLCHHLPAFDAFFCAWTAFLADLNQCAKRPSNFPRRAGWIAFPGVRPTPLLKIRE
jgi:hypothetical protein